MEHKSKDALVQTSSSLIFDQAIAKIALGGATYDDIKTLMKTPEFYDELAKLERWQLLPFLFKIRGIPFSLDDYPQFRYMYSRNSPGDILYLCGRQVAKSSNLSRSEVLDLTSIPNYQVLYVAPLQAQANRYSMLYLKEAIMSCEPARILQTPSECDLSEGPIIKSVGHQAFLNNSGIQMMYAKTSADRARGITADRIDYDEVQDQLVDHLPVIAESMTNSSWSFQRFCGTAKTNDNTIEHLWRGSSMSEWGVKCPSCNHWNIPDKDHGVLDMISVYGPCCAKCRTRIYPREGKLIHGRPDRADEFLGIHVPQIMVPAITEDTVKWQKLIGKVQKLPESLIYTEILGISHDAGVRLITQEDIDKASCLGTHDELRRKLSEYSHIALGIDWGIAEISSFTVATVVGFTPDGKIHVLFCKRYMGMNMEDVLVDIIRIYHSYRCTICTPDFGVGFTNNTLLRNRGIDVSQVQYVNSNALLKFNAQNNSPRWMLDRNTALTLVFWGVKYGKIFFPNKSDSGHYTSDLLSPYEEYVELESGIAKKKFLRDPSRPDDFCHALTFASVLLMRMAGDPTVNLVPETSIDYTGREFPEEGIKDMDSVMAALRQS